MFCFVWEIFCCVGVPLQIFFVSWEIIEIICYTITNFAITNLVFWGVRITCMNKVTHKIEEVLSVYLTRGQVHLRL